MLPGALQPDRGDELTSWIDGQDFTPEDAPGLWFHHVILPHDPWIVLDDLSPYASVDAEPYGPCGASRPPARTGASSTTPNVWNTDVLPTISELSGIDLSWDIDGVPASRADRVRAPGDKPLLGSELHEIDPAEGSSFIELDGRAGLDRVVATDPVGDEGDDAVWQRTDHGALVGRNIDQLAVEEDGVGTLRVERLDRIERRGDDPPLLELPTT